jgi:hypothetical protein
MLAAAALACAAPRIYYSKSFPGSLPPFMAIVLERSGAGEYKEAPDDENPVKFQLKASEAGEIFALSEKLGRFTRPLESAHKVAQMGMKTFRWEDGATRNEVKFNYSDDLDARLLADWFERISESAQHLINLERAARFDKLGVNRALLLLEAAADRKRLVAMEQYLPMLDRISNNESYLHMARQRAARLASWIRQPPAEAGGNGAASQK